MKPFYLQKISFAKIIALSTVKRNPAITMIAMYCNCFDGALQIHPALVSIIRVQP